MLIVGTSLDVGRE
jgi:hypothetical protein